MNMFQKFFGHETPSPSANNPMKKSRAALKVETLEERQMLSINSIIGGPIDPVTIAAGATEKLSLNVESDSNKAAMIGVVVKTTEGNFDPSALVVLDSEGKEISKSDYYYSFDGTDRSAIIVKLTDGDYQIQVAGDNNSFGSFTCDVFMPGVDKPTGEDGTGTAKVTQESALRANVAKDQDSGNYNANTILYYTTLGKSLGLTKPGFDAAKSQYRDYFDLNDDGVIEPQEAYVVQYNADTGASYTVSLEATAAISLETGVTHWLVSDSEKKEKTAVLEINGTTSSNVTKLEAIFVDASGASTTATDITSYLQSASGGKTFTLNEEAILKIFGKTSGTLDYDDYKIKFIATTNDEKAGTREVTQSFTFVEHSEPVSQSVAEKTLNAVSTDTSVTWDITGLVVSPGTLFSYTIISVVDENGKTVPLTHGEDPVAVENASGTIVGYLSYADGKVGADGKYYNGKLYFTPTEEQVALSKGAADIAVTLKFLVQDDSATAENKTKDDETIKVLIHPVNKTPVVNVESATKTFNPGDAEYTYKLSGTATSTSAVIATDANTNDALAFNYDKIAISVGGTTLTATGSSGANRVWTTPQGTVITLVWDSASSSYTELKVNPVAADDDDNIETEVITISFTVLDDAGVATAANGDQASETTQQTLTVTVNGVDAAPIISGSNLVIDKAAADAGNITTGWTATGKDITTYKVGTSTSNLVNIPLGGTATVTGVGTFRLETNGSLTWISVDDAMKPTDVAKTSNFVFQAINEKGTGEKTFTITVNPVSNYVFADQDLYLSPNSPEVGGKVKTGTALVSEGSDNVAYTIVSVKDASGATVDANLFVIEAGRIVVEKDSLGTGNDLPFGNYTFEIKAVFDGSEANSITAEVTLHIGEGTPATVTAPEITIGEKATAAQEASANVTGITGENSWSLVADSATINATAQISAHKGTAAYELTLDATELGKLLSRVTLTKDGNNVKCVFTPDTDFTAIFQFLSEGQTATMTLNYDILEEYYGLVTSGTFTIVVTGANDQPVGVGTTINKGTISAESTEGVKIAISELLQDDKDLADTHFVVSTGSTPVALKEDGDTATLASGATITYVADPDGDYIWYVPNGADPQSSFYSLQKGALRTETISMYISDDSEASNAQSSVVSTIDVTLEGVNKPPHFIDSDPINETVTEKTVPSDDGSFSINIYDIAADPNRVGSDGDTLTFGDFFDADGSKITPTGTVATTLVYTLSDGSTITISESGTLLTFNPTTRRAELNLRQFTAGDTSDNELKGITWDSISVSFTVKDNQNDDDSESEAKKTLNVTITGVNDAPVAADVAQNVAEGDAVDAWFATGDKEGDYDKWIKIDWRESVNDPDINETDMLAFTINGQALTLGTAVDFADGSFILRMENGERVLRFRPSENYTSLLAGETAVLDSFTLQVTDPIGLSASCNLNLTIDGETTIPNVGPGVQEFYLSTEDTPESLKSVQYYTDRDDPARPTINGDGATCEDVPGGATFTGFSVNSEGKIVIDYDDPALAADFASFADGDILVYSVPFTYEGENAGFVLVSIIKGEAPVTVDDTEYTLEVSEKATTPVDRPYDPILNPHYEIHSITALESVVVTNPNNETEVVPLPEDLELGVHYGINEDGRFWFLPGDTFHFLREGQVATVEFTIRVVNEYGKPIGGEAGTMTVNVIGVNDTPEVKQDPEPDTIFANDTDGIQIKVADLFSDVDVDDTHTIVIIQGETETALVKDGAAVTLPSGATLRYVTDAAGDYILYQSNGWLTTSPFYSLKSGATEDDVVKFKVRDDSGTETALSEEGSVTFNVRGVNKTPVVNEDLLIPIDAGATAGITVTANEISTDANDREGDLDNRYFVSIAYGDQTFTAAGTYEITAEYKDQGVRTLGTLVIASGMASFTFTPNTTLLTDESVGLEPYDPLIPATWINLNFKIVLRDSSGILADDLNGEQPARTEEADMVLQLQGATQGPYLKEPDFYGSIHVDADPNHTLDAGVFFGGKGVTFVSANIPNLSNTFLKDAKIENGQLVLEYISAQDYRNGMNLYPIEIEVMVVDENGETITDEYGEPVMTTIRIHVQEQVTSKVYVIPSKTPAGDTEDEYESNVFYYRDQDFPENYAGDDKDNPFVIAPGETYYLEIWVQDNLNELLGFTDDDLERTLGIAGGEFSFIMNGSEDDEIVEFFRRAGATSPTVGSMDNTTAKAGTINYNSETDKTVIEGMSVLGESGEYGMGMPPKGWIMMRIRMTATGEGTPEFELVFDDDRQGDEWALYTRYLDNNNTQNGGGIHVSQIDIVMPVIQQSNPTTPLTALEQAEKEVDGGIYMKTVTKPTEVDANGCVSEMPSDADMLHEWQSHYVELWVKASEADQYINATVDLNYNTDYFTAVEVERGSAFRYGSLPVIDDANGLVSGIGGATKGYISEDGYILLGRVRFESVGTDNVPWSESSTPHSLGLSLSNGGVQHRNGLWVHEMGSGSKTELWANPYDSDDDGAVTVLDYTNFVRAFGVKNEDGSPVYSNFNVTRSGVVTVIDFSYFASNFGTKREEVTSGKKVISFPLTFTNRYAGKTLQADNTALVGAMLDVANQAWADALGLDKPIDVQLGVKDFGDSTTLAEAQLLEVDANGLPSKGIITLDDDAAGLGWYSQIAEPVNASKYDLYTTLLHELGHLYGYNEAYLPYVLAKEEYSDQVDSQGHSLNTDDVMYEGLNTGERKQLSTLDVEVVKAAYSIAQDNPGMTVLLTQTPTRLEALGAKVETVETVEEVATFEAVDEMFGDETVTTPTETAPAAAPAVAAEAAPVTQVSRATAVIATQFSENVVTETTVQLTVAVAQESAMPKVVVSEDNDRTLAELNTLGLDVALPQVNPTYSIASNVDQVVGELFPTDDEDLFGEEDGFAFANDGQSALLDQLISDLY